MPVSSCTCSSFRIGAPSKSEDGFQLHHAFCPAWTMMNNYIYPGLPPIHGKNSAPSRIHRYTFAHSPHPTIFYIIHYRSLTLFLSFPPLHHHSTTVQHDLLHEFIPPSEYAAYNHTTPAHRRIIRHFTPGFRPLDLSAWSASVVQAFVHFVSGSPLLGGLRTERQWLQLGGLALVFGMEGLFGYAEEGLGRAVGGRAVGRKVGEGRAGQGRGRKWRRRGGAAVWEVVGRLRRMVERDLWRGVEDEFCCG